MVSGVTLTMKYINDKPRFTLTCVTIGGPATIVMWMGYSAVAHAEQINTVLDDPVTAQYTHTLTVTDILERQYHCIIRNKISETRASFNTQGELIVT